MNRCLVCKDLDESVSIDCGIPLRQIIDSFDDGEGCSSCGVLLQSYLTLKDGDAKDENILLGWDTTRLQGLRVVIKEQGDSTLVFSIDLFCHKGDIAPWPLRNNGESATDISGDTASDAAISRLSEWIRSCQSDHRCKGHNPVACLPTRVLDVSDSHDIRLRRSLEGETDSYACLSHCWGRAQSLVTTISNVAQHQKSIAWGDLPKAFQDAISITRRLGIPYLWIDSLCIIQDSQADWNTESTKMASIYAGSTITIAATMSYSDADSFISLSPASHISQKITYRSHSGLPQTIHARRTLTHGHGPMPFPLLTRGWVLQERFLSPRVVHFTLDELIWECMERTTCECGCIRSLWSPGWVPFNKDLLYEPNLARASRADLQMSWQQVVQEYSRLSLSFSRDRLPAISGAARRFSCFRRCNYYAGLWEDSFVRDLMWKRHGPRGTSTRLSSVPSWSWASINAEVAFREATSLTAEMVAVMDTAVELVPGSDQFGEIRGGTVTLSGFLVALHQQLEMVLISAEHDATSCANLHDLGTVTLDVDGDDITGPGYFCLKLCFQSRITNSEDNREVSMILQCVDSEASLFRRMGLFERSFEETRPDIDIYEHVNETTILTIL